MCSSHYFTLEWHSIRLFQWKFEYTSLCRMPILVASAPVTDWGECVYMVEKCTIVKLTFWNIVQLYSVYDIFIFIFIFIIIYQIKNLIIVHVNHCSEYHNLISMNRLVVAASYVYYYTWLILKFYDKRSVIYQF